MTKLKRVAISVRIVHDVMHQKQIVTVASIMELCDTTAPTATSALSNLIELGIVKEVIGRE